MFKLCLVTDRKLFKDQTAFLRAVRDATLSGVDVVVLREKDILDSASLLTLAKKIKAASDGAKLLINGRCDVALAAGADGVHLTASSIPVKLARKLLGQGKLIGKSCHSIKDALVAQKDGVDYIFLGPIYFTESKAMYGKPLGCDIIKKLRKKISFKIPVLAVGGIVPFNTKFVLQAGADGIAVISGILKAKSPGLQTANYRRVLDGFRG